MTRGGRAAPRVAITLGDGPAYPVLGMAAAPPSPRGVALLTDDIRRHGLYLHKTLWAVSAGPPGELIISARRLSDRRPVGFYDGRRTHSELRITRPGRGWAYAATTALLPGGGCYAFHVSGRGVDERIVFRARTVQPTPKPGNEPRAWRKDEYPD